MGWILRRVGHGVCREREIDTRTKLVIGYFCELHRMVKNLLIPSGVSDRSCTTFCILFSVFCSFSRTRGI